MKSFVSSLNLVVLETAMLEFVYLKYFTHLKFMLEITFFVLYMMNLKV
jgi:hypothetical protein